MNNKIRVLVVDDSAFMRQLITNMLESDSRIEVIDQARNGQDALNKIHTLSPDLVTLDIHMPVMDGLTTLQNIMLNNPLPVLIISSSTTIGAKKTLRAMALGAVDFISKPSGSISFDIRNKQDEMIEKVVNTASANIKKRLIKQQVYIDNTFVTKYERSFVAIGASTGGPRALQEILTQLTANFKASILIVQHMPATFTRSLAERLNSLTNMTVKEAKHGEIVKQSTAYIAPGNYHMRVNRSGTSWNIQLTQDEPVHNHRPSVDVLFNSVAQLNQVNKIGIILTGMGRDGSLGVKNIKQNDRDSMIIAESEETAVVYGMPKAAKETKHVDQIIPLHLIGPSIKALIEKTRRE